MQMTAKPRYYRARLRQIGKRAEPPAPAPAIEAGALYRTLIDRNFSPEMAAGLCADRWL
jgi:hypothetical protein